MVRIALVFVVALCISAGATIGVLSRPWYRAAKGEELAVDHATLRPGTIALHLVNGSEDTARVAQVIVNDAYVDFNATRRSLAPDDGGTVAVTYPWIEGESYEIELLLSTGRAVMYDIEDAEPGDITAAA
jgi:zinc transporter, ZIP family